MEGVEVETKEGAVGQVFQDAGLSLVRVARDDECGLAIGVFTPWVRTPRAASARRPRRQKTEAEKEKIRRLKGSGIKQGRSRPDASKRGSGRSGPGSSQRRG